MRKVAFVKMLCLLTLMPWVVACGGGGDASAPKSTLDAYVGKWGSCNGAGQMEWLLVNRGADEGQLFLEVETSFHANADCSGSPGAYLIHSGASIVAKKSGMFDVPTTSFPSVRSLQGDAFKTTTSAGTVRVLSTGMSVDYSRLNNTPGSWCVDGVAGTRYCFQENDRTLIAGDEQVGFLLENNQLYSFYRDVDTTYKSKIAYRRY